MIDYCKIAFKLDKMDKNGVSDLRHLLALEKSHGIVDENLRNYREASMPVEALTLFNIFRHISARRSFSEQGELPLSWQDLHAYCSIFDKKLSSWEIDMLLEMDNIYLTK